MREYWVIEDSRKHAVFSTDAQRLPKGYIPREVGEKIIGRKTCDNECVFFSRDEVKAMHNHPEWRASLV